MDIIIELIVQRIIVRTFGYYTLLLFFKIFKNKEGIKWLDAPLDKDGEEGEEFGRGCMIGIVGLLSFTAFIMILLYLINYLFY
ncbi:MAG TPA: hypothetical protein ENK91_02065 [Bacteroidetes bacterium]|nr:hypothetical protein [Bacteroidota bacterium]